jgi:DNA-binding response OmpR family regulator
MPELKRVTVVNDSPEFLELMADLLHDANYPATLVDGDRDNATDLIEASQPEILIIDLRLGTEDLKGLDILRWIRGHPELSNVPTIVCTADKWGIERVEDEVRSMERVKILMKPFSIAELYSTLRELQPV